MNFYSELYAVVMDCSKTFVIPCHMFRFAIESYTSLLVGMCTHFNMQLPAISVLNVTKLEVLTSDADSDTSRHGQAVQDGLIPKIETELFSEMSRRKIADNFYLDTLNLLSSLQ